MYRCYRLGETATVAERPLVEWVHSPFAELDALAASVGGSAGLEPSTTPIGDMGASDVRHVSSTAADLRVCVLRAVPGELESAYLGTVTAVRPDEFDAQLVDVRDDDVTVATMRAAQLPDAQAAGLEPGAAFTWSVFRKDDGHTRTRTSRLRLTPLPEIDLAELDATAAVLHRLVDDLDPGAF